MWKLVVVAALLFFVLTPGVVVRLPPHGTQLTVAATHAVVFGVVWALVHKKVLGML